MADKERMGGWCVYYIPMEDQKGNSAGHDSFHTYRLTENDFDALEEGFHGSGSSFETVIAETKLPDQIGGNNLEYLHRFVGEVDPDSEHWTASIF